MEKSRHLTKTEIESYEMQSLSPNDLLALTDHLQVCEECRTRIIERTGSTAAVTAALLRSRLFSVSLAGECLSYEEKEAFVDEVPAEEFRIEIVAHLDSCQSCRHGVAEMMAVKSALENLPPIQPATESVWWRQLKERLRRFAFFPAWKPALATSLVLAALGIAAWRFLPPSETLPSEANLTRSKEGVGSSLLNPSSSPNPLAVTLNDVTGIITVNTNGGIEGLAELTVEEQELLRNALIEQKLPLYSTTKKPARDESLGALMSEGNQAFADASKQLFPNDIAIETNSPQFRWPAVNGATGYVVTVYDENLMEVISSENLRANEWKTPKPLPRGKVYGWQLTINKGGQESILPSTTEPRLRFRVIERKHAAALQRGRRELGGSHLLLGLFYSRAGMLKEAETEFRQLLIANPNSTQAQFLLQQILHNQRRER